MGTFSAFLSGKNNYSLYQLIIFPNATYNTGDYSTTTGEFTAPVSGIYVFLISLVGCNDSDSMSIRMQKGSSVIGYAGVGLDSGGESYEAGSASFIVSMQSGDKITLDAISYSGSAGFCLYGSEHAGYSYYSGFLLEGAV